MPLIWSAEEAQQLKQALSHVLWIGGATDAGKTTTAAMLAEKYGFQVYHGDKHWRENWSHVTAQGHPAMYAWDKMNMDERWVSLSIEGLTELTLQIMVERLPLMADDLIAMPSESMIVAEWYGFLPSYIMPLLSNRHQALWMLPNNTFKQASIQRRQKSAFHLDTSNPQKAWNNHLQRDLKIAKIIQQQAECYGARIIVNDGIRNPSEVLAQVEAHFLPYLP